MDTETLQLPSTTAQTADVNLAWKKIVLDLCTEHLRDALSTTTEPQSSQDRSTKKRRAAFQLPTSDSVHLLDTDQLWQSLEFQNKSILPATKRRLRRLLPPRSRTTGGETAKARGEGEKEENGDFVKERLSDHSKDGSEGSSLSTDPASGENADNLGPKVAGSEAEARNSKAKDPSALEDLGNALPSDDEEPHVTNEVKKKLRLIEALEEKNVAPKPWSLRGEVAASSRPKNSLLESTFEYDTVRKPNLLAVGDLNDAIEDMIKRRIIDARFDDVVLQEAPSTDVPEKRDLEVDDMLSEKPRKGLGELYEEEYRESDRTKQESLSLGGTTASGRNKEIAEIYAAFEQVSQKLDALSGLSATPMINDIAKTPAEAVPEDVVKEDAIVTIQESEQVKTSDRKTKSALGSGSRDQRKKKRRKRRAV